MGTDKSSTGQFYDAVSGLYYYHARYYDPVVDAFLTPDNVQGAAQGMNPYMYVAGNPETNSDPTGQALVIDGGTGNKIALGSGNHVNHTPFIPVPTRVPTHIGANRTAVSSNQSTNNQKEKKPCGPNGPTTPHLCGGGKKDPNTVMSKSGACGYQGSCNEILAQGYQTAENNLPGMLAQMEQKVKDELGGSWESFWASAFMQIGGGLSSFVPTEGSEYAGIAGVFAEWGAVGIIGAITLGLVGTALAEDVAHKTSSVDSLYGTLITEVQQRLSEDIWQNDPGRVMMITEVDHYGWLPEPSAVAKYERSWGVIGVSFVVTDGDLTSYS